MTTETDPEFWKWLRDKVRKEAEQEENGFEPIPLYIQIEKPRLEPALNETEEVPHDSLKKFEIDYSIDC